MAKATLSRLLWTAAFVVWLCVVWGHSLMPADESLQESSRFVLLIKDLLGDLVRLDERTWTLIVRKTAHFSEFLVLMLITTGWTRACWSSLRRIRTVRAVVWVLVPVIDETIQFFVPGREMHITDMCIDMAGGMLGMLIAHVVITLRNSRSERRLRLDEQRS